MVRLFRVSAVAAAGNSCLAGKSAVSAGGRSRLARMRARASRAGAVFQKKRFTFTLPHRQGVCAHFCPKSLSHCFHTPSLPHQPSHISHLRCETSVKRLRRPARGATPANRLYTGTYTACGEGEGYFFNFIFSKSAWPVCQSSSASRPCPCRCRLQGTSPSTAALP